MIVTELVKTRDVIKVSAGDILSQTLSKLSTSHDAAFVFDDNNKFLGAINPYHCLIKSSYPGNAKVEHCLFHAPKLKTNYPIAKIAQLMIESKTHYLPVFNDNENFIGIISARRLFSYLIDSPAFKIKIKEILQTKKRTPVTIYEDDFISSAINIFKMYKVSKLVVVNKEMKLKGILSYYDLISFLIAPKEKEHRGERTGNKSSFNHQRVKNFAKSLVLPLSPEGYLKDAVQLILEKKIGSVVITDQDNHPIGIITTRDLLSLLLKGNHEKKIEITSKNLSHESRQILGGFFNRLSLHLKKFPDLSKAKLLIKEEKDGGLFKVVLSLFPNSGRPKVIMQEGKNLLRVLKIVKDKGA